MQPGGPLGASRKARLTEMGATGAEVPPTPAFIFLAWQDPQSRRWFPVGRLWREGTDYRFGYLQGFSDAAREAGLAPLPSFPEPGKVYASENLFPLFRNRVMNAAREDFESYLERLGLVRGSDGDRLMFDILARSRGIRSTDSFEIFPLPLVEGDASVQYRLDFFVHGVRHTPDAAQAAAQGLESGARLYLLADLQNPEDPRALALRTPNRHLVGYLPRYYCADLHDLMASGERVDVTVLRVNPPPAPPQQRLLCRVASEWPFERQPLSQAQYRLLGEGPAPVDPRENG